VEDQFTPPVAALVVGALSTAVSVAILPTVWASGDRCAYVCALFK
jgi:hypothetical protein